ncbi:MAG TPA: hypothetical protein VFQ70_03310 [Candidatus Saccharimonadaceae bacterium]|nr:hypothetical protein [Candidatus Saccharimonadaceae bacterium]
MHTLPPGGGVAADHAECSVTPMHDPGTDDEHRADNQYRGNRGP